MVIRKKKITQMLLGLEIVFFCAVYVFSKNGLPALRMLMQENRGIEQEIAHINDDIKQLECELLAWSKYPYYREKVAREQLHMACSDEIIYVLPEKESKL